MFILKKIISAFTMPLPAGLLIIVIGLFFLWLTGKQKTGKVIVTSGTLLLVLLGSTGVSDYLIKYLENSHSRYTQSNGTFCRYIVVLNGGALYNHNIPAMTQVSLNSLARVVEGVKLYKANPGSKMIFTGGNYNKELAPQSFTLARLALSLGVKKNDIIVDTKSLDTKDEASYIKKIVNDNKFLLVTSAFHMKRALAMFKGQRLNPIPAPAEYLVNEAEKNIGLPFGLPNASNLQKSEFAIHEYLGIMWAKLRGQI